MIAAAIPTFKDSALPTIGILIRWSERDKISSLIPFASFPTTITEAEVKSASVYDIVLSDKAPLKNLTPYDFISIISEIPIPSKTGI